MAERKARRPGPRGAWTAELGEAYLALLRDTGNARESARALGHPHLFYNRMRRYPAFRRACGAAVRAADARLLKIDGPFVPAVEIKALSPPGPKRRSGKSQPQPQLVIRKTSNGRTQISHAREGSWTLAIEMDFLARLRETGNFEASARAVGFHPRSVYRRLAQWPAFANDCREAIEAAEVQLDYKLVAHAHALLRRPGEPCEGGEESNDDIPFDPEAAMRILGFIERRRGGRTTRGPRKGPPERSFDEAVASVLAKIEAIERHEKKMKGGEGTNTPPLDGEGSGAG